MEKSIRNSNLLLIFLIFLASFSILTHCQTQCTQQSCDDGNPCTTDLCDSFGACRHFQKPPNTSCDDGLFCNGEDKCQAGVCVHLGNPCPAFSLATACFSTCTEGGNGKNGTCNAPNGTKCDDGKYCTRTDLCDGLGACLGRDSPCSRTNQCNNTCTESLKSCNAPTGKTCTTSKFCDGTGTCNAGTCSNFTPPCASNGECNNQCNETNRNCFSPFGTTCSHPLNVSCSFGKCGGDGYCNVGLFPFGTSCQVNNCTTDAFCVDSSCARGAHTCECSIDSDCDDLNPCTVDTCSPGGICSYRNATEGSPCDDGLYCNGNDFCSAGICSNHTGDPCTLNTFCSNTCNENARNCHRLDDTPCPDSLFCNGIETCKTGLCKSSGDPCKGGGVCNSTCSEGTRSDGTGTCAASVGISCEDGIWCNGEEKCDGSGGCNSGLSPCLNGNQCNSTCNEIDKNCWAPSNLTCNAQVNCEMTDAKCVEGNCFLYSFANCTGSPPKTGPMLSNTENPNSGPSFTSSSRDPSDFLSTKVPIIVGSVGGFILIIIGIVSTIFIVSWRKRRGKDMERGESMERGDVNPFFSSPGNYNSPDINSFSPRPIHSPSLKPSGLASMLNPSFLFSSPNILLSPKSNHRESSRLSPEPWQNGGGGSLSQFGTKTVTQAELEANVKSMEEVEVIKLLGTGNFGEVYMGVWHKPENNGIVIDVEVALKKLKVKEQFQEFCHEAATLQSMLHPHIVRYYGIFIDQEGGDSFIATEYMRMGSLLELLQNSSPNEISEAQMLEMALGAAIGMAYLESSKIVHRDLSCRNLLVSMDARGHYIVKVSDFGMSKCLEQNYYVASDSLIPVRWSAIEVLKFKRFSSKSDVWSFGIILWEIFEKGREPYTHMSNKQVVNAILSGERLEQPKDCPADIYQLMTLCWKDDPAKRPNFEEVLNQLWKATEKRESSGKTEAAEYLRDSSVVHETYEQTDCRIRRGSNADDSCTTTSGRSFQPISSFKDEKKTYAQVAKEIHNHSEGFSEKESSDQEEEMHEISLEKEGAS